MILQSLFQSQRLGVQSLTLHKLRSFLTILGVVFGVASVIIMLAVGEGAKFEAIEAIRELGATNIIVRSVKPPSLTSGGDSGGAIRYGLSHNDLARMRNTLSGYAKLAPIRHHRRQFWHNDQQIDGRIVGVTPAYADLKNLSVERGRFIAAVDCSRTAAVAVLGAEVAESLFPLSNPIGNSIRVGEDQYYEVVGILGPRAATAGMGADSPPEAYGRDVYIPFSSDQKRFGENVVFDRTSSQPPEKLEISQITIAVQNTDQVRPTARILTDLIQSAGKEDHTSMTVPLDLLEKTEQTQRIFTWVLTAIASISLMVGGIGIMNIMLATVTERTRGIGIRRALGARRRDIIWQFLIETTVLSCSGGVIGICLGVGSAFLISQLAEIPTIVLAWTALLAFAISVGVGLMAGLYPAIQAAYLDPIEALRRE
jgi:putative ABC transport system permease protein